MVEKGSTGSRQRAEVLLKSLPDSALSLIRLQERSPLPFTMVTPDGYFIACNGEFCRLTGYRREELLSMYWEKITPPEQHDRFVENWMMLSGGQLPRIESDFLKKNGSRISVEIFPNQIVDPKGTPLCYYAFVANITDWKNTERALRQTEERYQLLVGSTEDFIYIIDRDLQVAFLNQAGAKSLGLSPDEAIGRHLKDIFPAETFRYFSRNLLKVFDTGQPISDIHEFGFPGKHFWLHVKLTPVRDESGNVTHVTGISRDIGDLKRAEMAVRESERRLSQAQSIAHIGNWEWDIKSDNITCSDEVYRIFGTSGDTAPFRFATMIRFIHPEDVRALKKMIRTGKAIARPGRMDVRIKRPDGEVRYIQLISRQIVRDGRGDPVLMFGTVQDITDRKQIEIALRQNEARLQALLELNDMADAPVKDLIDFALEKAISLTRSKIGYIGTVSADRKYIIIESFSRQTMQECGITDKPITYQVDGGGLWPEPIALQEPVIINDSNAPHPLKKGFPEGLIKTRRLISIPVMDNGRIVAQCMLGGKETPYDESDIRQLDLLLSGLWRLIQRKNTEAELLESKAMAELYVDLMGHDINNMNQIAQGYLEMAQDLLALDHEKKEFLDKPLEVLSRSSKLIGNVRKLQQIRSGEIKMEIMDLGQVLEEVCSQYREVPDRKVTINSILLSGTKVRANALLPDVIANLIENAIKHSITPRVDIDINVAKVYSGNGWYFRVEVEDNGPGIDDELKKRIFDRHQRGATTAKGSGLGLHLARSLVESYHGKIWAEDRMIDDPSRGSRFVVLLPVIAGEAGFFSMP